MPLVQVALGGNSAAGRFRIRRSIPRCTARCQLRDIGWTGRHAPCEPWKLRQPGARNRCRRSCRRIRTLQVDGRTWKRPRRSAGSRRVGVLPQSPTGSMSQNWLAEQVRPAMPPHILPPAPPVPGKPPAPPLAIVPPVPILPPVPLPPTRPPPAPLLPPVLGAPPSLERRRPHCAPAPVSRPSASAAARSRATRDRGAPDRAHLPCPPNLPSRFRLLDRRDRRCRRCHPSLVILLSAIRHRQPHLEQARPSTSAAA